MLETIREWALQQAKEKEVTHSSYDTGHYLGQTEMQFASIYAVARGLNVSLEAAEQMFNIVEVGLTGTMSEKERQQNQKRAIKDAYESVSTTGKPTFLHVNYEVQVGTDKSGKPTMGKHWSVIALTKDQETGKITITNINTAEKGLLRNKTIEGVVKDVVSYVMQKHSAKLVEFQDCSVDRQCDNCCGLSAAISDAEVVAHLATGQPIDRLPASQRSFGGETERQAKYSAFARGMYSVMESTQKKDFNKPVVELEITALQRNGLLTSSQARQSMDSLGEKDPQTARKMVSAVVEITEYRKQVNVLVDALAIPYGKHEGLKNSLWQKHTKGAGKVDIAAVKADVKLIETVSEALYDINSARGDRYDINPVSDGSNKIEAIAIYERLAKKHTVNNILDQEAMAKEAKQIIEDYKMAIGLQAVELGLQGQSAGKIEQVTKVKWQESIRSEPQNSGREK